MFKACVRYFLTNFYYHQMIALQKLWKMFYMSSKKTLLKKFLVYELETSRNCKEVKHILIMIIAIIYIFSSDVIFDQQLKITFTKSSAPPWKNPPPSKNSEIASPAPFLPKLKIFRTLLQKWRRTLWLCLSILLALLQVLP